MDYSKLFLEFRDVTLNFGGVTALNALSFTIGHSELLAIIGPNGAGKTCILNCINGYYRPQKGKVFFEGKDITSSPPHRIPELGIARTFQNIELFKGLTALENIMAGRHRFIKTNLLAKALYFGWAKRTEIQHRKVAEEILDFLEVKPIRHKITESLPYGMQKRIQLGQALAMEPKMLLLDEPMAGMNLEEKEDIARFIIDISEEREISIVLIEHDMDVVMDIAERIVVMDFGRKIAEGTPEEIKRNPKVIQAYLGEPEQE